MVAHTKRMLYTPGAVLERYGRLKAGAHGAGEYDCPVIKPCAGWGEAAPFRASPGCSLLVVSGLSAPLSRTSAARRISLRLENVETPAPRACSRGFQPQEQFPAGKLAGTKAAASCRTPKLRTPAQIQPP